MSEFCKDCFLKIFGLVDDDEVIIESKNLGYMKVADNGFQLLKKLGK